MAVTVRKKASFSFDRREQCTRLSSSVAGTPPSCSLCAASRRASSSFRRGGIMMTNLSVVFLSFLLLLSSRLDIFTLGAPSSSSSPLSLHGDLALPRTGAIFGVNEVVIPSYQASGTERQPPSSSSEGFLKLQRQPAVSSSSSQQSIRPYHTKPSERAAEYSSKSGIPLCHQCSHFNGDGRGCRVCIHGEISSDVSLLLTLQETASSLPT